MMVPRSTLGLGRHNSRVRIPHNVAHWGPANRQPPGIRGWTMRPVCPVHSRRRGWRNPTSAIQTAQKGQREYVPQPHLHPAAIAATHRERV